MSTPEGPAAPADHDTGSPAGATAPRKWYRLLTGDDDAAFCLRVSEALAEGYVLYGSPAIAREGGRTVVAQAVVLPESERGESR